MHKLGLDAIFELRGQVDDLAPRYRRLRHRDSSVAAAKAFRW